ncbi:MAG: tRNA (N(6)-L-threonylcarbamoyladenosine(37)-C(2))-methylthiotransferase MtaB [Opitutae bacterium]|jgi:threonylcarbamoyladenosine tRNA methylthiotransferase MtaB|nr:tRNA (N(6)-L-threonylcarbamoyladenosine(37)-C(2))-methylthiotransferase MtaB [Opitutae bacterium]MBT7740413.1 tRNA (N(6)-L-threonylcarbamoyladenosine(37)-C(2))-methylthiotransferase MtaB [Opitutae bacterium]MBT7924396.1 tRNA (N(6)-L-threonylcarbamoyladenosine(37)-C(2))-methylthiotransferase MtaB [Opitutae bacterium]
MIANPQTKRASVRALGCRLNQYEVTAIADRLALAGYQVVPFGEPADLGVINTCTVTNEADAKSRNVIRRFIRVNPQAVTVVVGCYSQVGASSVAEIPGVDYVIGNQDKMNLLEYIGEKKTDRPVVVRERIDRNDFSLSINGDSPFEWRANLKVQDGCDFMCSFCIIPFARGRARSRAFDNLMEEAHSLADRGVREVILTGVNIGTYQSQGYDFLALIGALSSVSGLARIRISSIEPTTIPEQLFPLMADPSHPLLPYLHVPLQAGCDRTLVAMKRKYQLDEIISFIQKANELVPNLCIGTDLMAGFPGETNDDFEQTCRTFLEHPFSYCHAFTFSERSGTSAARVADQVPMEERRRRSDRLRVLSASKRHDFYEAQVGREAVILMEDPKNGFWPAYTENYVRVLVDSDRSDLANRIARVRLDRARPEYVEAELLEVLDET